MVEGLKTGDGMCYGEVMSGRGLETTLGLLKLIWLGCDALMNDRFMVTEDVTAFLRAHGLQTACEVNVGDKPLVGIGYDGKECYRHG